MVKTKTNLSLKSAIELQSVFAKSTTLQADDIFTICLARHFLDFTGTHVAVNRSPNMAYDRSSSVLRLFLPWHCAAVLITPNACLNICVTSTASRFKGSSEQSIGCPIQNKRRQSDHIWIPAFRRRSRSYGGQAAGMTEVKASPLVRREAHYGGRRKIGEVGP